MNYSCTIKSNNNITDCSAWAISIMPFDDNSKFKTFSDISMFMWYVYTFKNKDTIFLNGMNEQGPFIVNYLYDNNFKFNRNKDILKEGEFSCLISGGGKWYSIDICIDKKTVVRIWDSKNIVRMDIEQLAPTFDDSGIADRIKRKSRQIGYQPDESEQNALLRECIIIKNSVNFLFERNMKRMTIGSDAMDDYKKTVRFKDLFPILTLCEDKEIRQAYRGGYNYCNPKFRNKKIGKGIVLDVNWLYPYIMDTELLPYGQPIFCEGEPEKDEAHPLWIGQVRFEFELKKKHLPCIQIRHGLDGFNPNEYLESSMGKCVVMTITNVDWELINEQYDTFNIEWFGYYSFKASNKMFKSFISKWSTVKERASENRDKALRLISKMIPNNLSGKFATNPNTTRKIPIQTKHNGLIYKTKKEDPSDPIYTALSCFITAYGRKFIIGSAQKNYNRVLYLDTDSMHLLGWEIPDNVKIHNSKTGFFKIEKKFKMAKYITTKCYIDAVVDNENEKRVLIERTISGAPESITKQINFRNFNPETIFFGKEITLNVKGGTIQTATTFTIPTPFE